MTAGKSEGTDGPFQWEPFETPDIGSARAMFRLNALDDLIETPEGPGADEIWWLALLELEGTAIMPTTIDELLGRAKEEFPEKSVSELLRVPPEYDSADRSGDNNVPVVTVIARRAYLNAANEVANKLGVQRVILGGQAPSALVAQFSAAEPVALSPPFPVPEGTAVVAVIDNGMAIGHNLFRISSGAGKGLDETRVRFFWNMDADPSNPGAPAVHWRKDQIDALIAGNLHNGLLDEAAFYREIGLIDWSRQHLVPTAKRVSHGTHVMGLAAGMREGDPLAGLRPIIAVQLPTELTRDVSGYQMVPAIAHALHFIKKAAKKFEVGLDKKAPPVVVNFSFGNFDGPHDGTSEMALKIDGGFKSKQAHPRASVLPAGNANLAQCHARIELGPAMAETALDWRVQPEDLTSSFVEFWLPKGVDEDISLTVLPPGAPPVTLRAEPNQVQLEQLVASDGTVVGIAAYLPPFPPTMRGHFVIAIRPTAVVDRTAELAPAGTWKLTLSGERLADQVVVQSWIARDETLPGFPSSGRQSYFDGPGYVRLDRPGVVISPFDEPSLVGKPLSYDPADPGPVRRAGTLSGFACGNIPAVIGGFVRSDASPAAYSSSGPTDNADRTLGPDAAAVSDDSRVLRGVLSAGSSSGSMVALNGTSVAAPQAARELSGTLGGADWNARTLIRDKAVADRVRFPPPSPPPAPLSWRIGVGRLDLPDLFGQLRRPVP